MPVLFHRLLVAAVVGGWVLAVAPAVAEDAALIAKAESYLNAMTTLKGRFIQVAPSGESTEGSVLLARPGRMRLDYDPPQNIQIIARDHILYYYDPQLGQPSYLDLDSTPAGVLIRPQIALNSGDIKVVRLQERSGLIEITVHHPDNPGEGQITLVFTASPFALRQWRVLDAQRQTTTVSLLGLQSGVAVDGKSFEFVDPNFSTPQDAVLGRKNAP